MYSVEWSLGTELEWSIGMEWSQILDLFSSKNITGHMTKSNESE